MQEALLLEAIKQQNITIRPGEHYRLTLPSAKNQALLIWQDGTDLIIVDSQGAQITLQDYFTTCLEGNCSITIAEDGKEQGQQLTAEHHLNQNQTPRIVYASGDEDLLQSLLEQQQLDSALLNVIDIDHGILVFLACFSFL